MTLTTEFKRDVFEAYRQHSTDWPAFKAEAERIVAEHGGSANIGFAEWTWKNIAPKLPMGDALVEMRSRGATVETIARALNLSYKEAQSRVAKARAAGLVTVAQTGP